MLLKYFLMPGLLATFLLSTPSTSAEMASDPHEPQATGLLVGYTECGGNTLRDEWVDIRVDQSAVQWEYDGRGTLDLHHLNAAFSCCPEFKCEVSVDSNVITVKEVESSKCDCVCLYDVDYKIIGLTPGFYLVKFEELYLLSSDEILEFYVRVGSEPASDVIVAYRDHAPWLLDETPWGRRLTAAESSQLPEIFLPNFPNGSNCVVYEYTENVLRIRHQGIMVSCGLSIDVDITVEGNTIFIEEFTYAKKPLIAPAMFRANLEMKIYSLPPDVYQVSITGPEGLIQLTFDLVYVSKEFFCPEEEFWDWGDE